MGAVVELSSESMPVASRWDDAEAAAFPGALEQRLYTSRLLGRDPSLVLHGGGNTSVKLAAVDLFGDEVDVLHVKGSGTDLATIVAADFSPLRLDAVRRLAELDELSDLEMARQLRAALVDPDAPAPSVEAILHALLPARFVDHTHPDALLSVMNTPSGRERVEELYGDAVVVVPYTMPGFALAKACAAELERQMHADALGLVLLQHGLLTFGDSARESYERTIAIVARAEAYLRERDAWSLEPRPPDAGARRREGLCRLRRDLSKAAGGPLVVREIDGAVARWCAASPDLAASTQRGPATPDHVIRTKRVPLLGRDVAAYAEDYERYFAQNVWRAETAPAMLDPAPRVVLDPELGALAAGRTPAEAAAVADIVEHTLQVICRAERLEAWQPLPEADIFDVEYWQLEQAKLTRGRGPFAGEIVLVTGAASGIGRAAAAAFLERGAAVAALDLDDAVETAAAGPAYLGLVCDVTGPAAVRHGLEATARAFGGLDMLVLNAGVFPASAPIAELEDEAWRRTLGVNLDANFVLLREALSLLREAPSGGRVVVVASKNVPAPGPGAAAYSASKAALTQLARVAALEWGGDGIRVNVIHPNAVYDTGLWNDQVLSERAAAYGLTVEEYRTANLLRQEVTSADVARMIVELCGPAFARTTGAQIPVDGGNERVV